MMIETRQESSEPLTHLVSSSALFGLLSRAGARIVVAWKSSALAALLADWMASPLDRRLRLVAVAVAVAVGTHVALTGFAAPEPTWWARAVWLCAVVTSIVVAISSRAVASAWTHWKPRRQSGGRPA